MWAALALPGSDDRAPGTLLAASASGIDIATAQGILRILEIQREGGRRMPVRDWLNARPELLNRAGGGPS